MNTSTLRKISIGYLLLPNLLFAWGWFAAPVSIAMILILLYLFYTELKKQPDTVALNTHDIMFLFVIVAVWTFLSGSGGYSYQTYDTYGHNSKFHDLSFTKWPYYFPETGRLVRYYFGYYLVPAGIFKLTGKIYPFVIYAWTFAGFFLGLSWAYILIFKNKILILVFLIVGGCGTYLSNLLHPFFELFGNQRNTFHINIGSLFDQSRWAPNQLIASLLVCGIILHDAMISRKPEESFFPLSLTIIWAIFPFVGLGIIYATIFFFYFQNHKIFKLQSIRTYVLPGLFLLPLLLFFATGDKTPINGFLWDFKSDGPFILKYLTGVFLDTIILLFISIRLSQSTDLFPKSLTAIFFMIFLLTTTFVLGKWNDWLTKINISFLILFLIIILRSIHSRYEIRNRTSINYLFLGVVVIYLGLNFTHQIIIAARPIRRNILMSYLTKETFNALPYNQYGNLYKTLSIVNSKEEAGQYMAKKNSFYERYLSKK